MNVHVGLCTVCVHARVIENRRGSAFWRCSLSDTDARFPRYPPLPVLRCAGFTSAGHQGGSESVRGVGRLTTDPNPTTGGTIE
ncbi:hypothetical protein BH23GEM9_BH23GEM9_03050 [soil metagenome]